ncbi:IS630 family transposase [Thiohalobacter sp. IOR34]|uniref:IS630 family transposase n=1 Tax=Thiohalobacter sp. IOR34 TaxID=3057176 RepID=UPI0025B16EAE|nr:IS630 family transposase [Thiohalobacter sp. IOR34]WJW76706.1 IS630 family transposase [Thiohalobacter sp. IOR34]
MSTTDARGLKHEELTELRKRGVMAVQNGESPEDVARILGISRVTIYNWLALYRRGGPDALDARKRGGRKRKLDAKSMEWLYEAITRKTPDQYRFPFVLWTSRLVGELIKEQLGISLSKASVCRLLNQLGLSAQRPLMRAHQQSPEQVDHWMNNEFPSIRAKAKREKAEIWFADEAGIRVDAYADANCLPKGGRSIVSSVGARIELSHISAVSPQGDFRFMCVGRCVSSGLFIDFLKRMIRSTERKVFLIVDSHPTHKAKMVGEFVESVADRLELIFLQPCSPEPNPDEFLLNDRKTTCRGDIPSPVLSN